MQIQISNMNVMVSCHSEDLPFNQSQESLRRMAFNELGTRKVLLFYECAKGTMVCVRCSNYGFV